MVKPDPTRNYYADLEISPNADDNEIRKAYRKLALAYHPDRNPGKEAEAVAKFQIIQTAQEVLIDPVQRAKYDADRRKYRGLHIPAYQPSRTRPPPPPRNTYTTTAAGGNYSYRPPPPRPDTRPPQYKPATAKSAGNTVPNGAERFKNFPRPPPTAQRPASGQQDKQARANVFTAWQNMKQQRAAEEARASTHDVPNTPNKGFSRTQSTRMPKKSGFDPSMPGADESQAPGSAYRSGYRRPDPSPPNMADASRHFKAPAEEAYVPFSEGNPRIRTPYSSTQGERTSMFTNEELRRSASARNSPHRPGSSEQGGFSSDTGRANSSRQRQSYGGNATKPFTMYSSSDDSDVEEVPPPPSTTQKPAPPPRQWPSSQRNGTASHHGTPPNADDSKANLGGFKSRSAESINMKFSPSDWKGTFEGNPDYFVPKTSTATTGKGRQSPTRGRSANRPRVNTNPNATFIPPPPAFPPPKTSQMPPPPPPPPSMNTRPVSSTTPTQARFTPEEWQDTFKEASWAYPRPETSPTRPPANTAKKGRPGTQRKASVPPQGVPVVDLTGDTPKKTTPKPDAAKPSQQPSLEEVSDDSVDEMDVDHTPPHGPSKAHPRVNHSVPTSPNGDKARGAGLKQSATAPTSATEPVGPGIDGLGSLRNVAPFAPEANGGLGGFTDIKSSLPFESQPSGAHPLKHNSAQKLDLPLSPRPPTIPNPLTIASADTYLRQMYSYFAHFRKFNNEMVSHFAAREAECARLDKNWLTNVGETTKGAGFDSYLKSLEEDNHARHHWQLGCEKHMKAMEDCEIVRKKVQKLRS